MKIILLIALLLVSHSYGFSRFRSESTDEIKEHLQENNWNVYAIYFFDSVKQLDDKVLRTHLKNDVLNTYGENVWFAEIDVSKPENQQLLEVVQFDRERDALVKGSARQKDVPFVMLMCHGLGWILQGDNAHHHVHNYMEHLISHAENRETVAHDF